MTTLTATPAVHAAELWLRPSQPSAAERAQYRAEALAAMTSTPPLASYLECDALESAELEEYAAYGVGSDRTEDTAITAGCTVRYWNAGYGSFTGVVLELNADETRAYVRFDDGFGVRCMWLGMCRLVLLMCAEAAEAGNGVR